VTGTVAVIAGVIRWPIALIMVLLGEATLAAAERCRIWPRLGLALLDIGQACSRVARQMLPPRKPG
jgi:hypothetical protein